MIPDSGRCWVVGAKAALCVVRQAASRHEEYTTGVFVHYVRSQRQELFQHFCTVTMLFQDLRKPDSASAMVREHCRHVRGHLYNLCNFRKQLYSVEHSPHCHGGPMAVFQLQYH